MSSILLPLIDLSNEELTAIAHLSDSVEKSMIRHRICDLFGSCGRHFGNGAGEVDLCQDRHFGQG